MFGMFYFAQPYFADGPGPPSTSGDGSGAGQRQVLGEIQQLGITPILDASMGVT